LEYRTVATAAFHFSSAYAFAHTMHGQQACALTLLDPNHSSNTNPTSAGGQIKEIEGSVEGAQARRITYPTRSWQACCFLLQHAETD
jgi:hypothetical protein